LNQKYPRNLPLKHLEFTLINRIMNPTESRAHWTRRVAFLKNFMKCKLLFFNIALLISLTSRAADPKFYRLKIIGERWNVTERSAFLEGKVDQGILSQLDSIYAKFPSGYEFNYNPLSKTLKVFVHCSFDFYAIKDGKLTKEYQLANRGYTCGSYFFEKNNTYHILSGRGLWNYHADLMEFDSLNGSWEFKQAAHQPLDYFPLGAYTNSKGVVTWLGEYNNPRIPRLEKEANGYFLDLKEKSWQPIRLDITDFDIAEIAHANESYLYETQDYALSVTTSQLPKLGWIIWIIVEKETGKLFIYEGNRNSEMFSSPYFEVIGNKLRYFDYAKNSVTNGKEVLIDLDAIRSQSREIGQVVLLDGPEKSSSNPVLDLLPWIGFPLVFILALWIGIQIQKRKRTTDLVAPDPSPKLEEEQDLEEDDAEILQQLKLHTGEKLSTEEFDTLLGIHEISNFDSKRIKRSRMIKSINNRYEEKNGFPLITRIKNPEDKRFVFYKITFESGG